MLCATFAQGVCHQLIESSDNMTCPQVPDSDDVEVLKTKIHELQAAMTSLERHHMQALIMQSEAVQIVRLHKEIEHVKTQLVHMRQSTSWRITAPLRWCIRIFRG